MSRYVLTNKAKYQEWSFPELYELQPHPELYEFQLDCMLFHSKDLVYIFRIQSGGSYSDYLPVRILIKWVYMQVCVAFIDVPLSAISGYYPL
jgi:hypothetical protein